MTDPWGLADKRVVITGASTGIGASLAEAFLASGAQVFGISRTPGDHAAQFPSTYRAYAADLSIRSETESVLQVILAEAGHVDVLINNAGSATRGTATDYPIEDWDRLLELNLTAPFLLSRGLAPSMIQQGAGKMIFTASLWSFLGGRNVPAYTVTKSGIAGLIRALSKE